MHLTLAHRAHLVSSSRNSLARLSSASLLAMHSARSRSQFSSNIHSSIRASNLFFCFLYIQLAFLAQPCNNFLRCLILYCHMSVCVVPHVFFFHWDDAISIKPSLSNQESSKEKFDLFLRWAASLESNRRDVWSETHLYNAHTIPRGYFCSHLTLTKTRSNFS